MTSPSTMQPRTEAFDVGGVRVLLRPNTAHQAVAVRLAVLGGSLHLSEQTQGADLLYARTARRGSQDYPKKRLHGMLDRLGIDLGAGLSEDWTIFHLRCLQRDLDDAWHLFVDVLRHPLLEAAELDVVREQTLLEIRQRLDTADGALSQRARDHAYRDHPYAHDPSGSEKSVSSLTPEQLRQHMRTALCRKHLLLVVAGDVSRGDLEDRVQRAFGDLPAGEEWGGFAPPLQFARGDLRTEHRDSPTNYLMGQFAAPALGDDTYPATLLAMSILRDRFFEEVRTKRNLSYAPAAGLGHLAANSGWIYVTAVDPRTTLEVMRQEMHKLGHEELSAQDLANKVQVYLTRYYLQNETNMAQAGFLGRYELLGGGWQRSLEFVERLEALQPADVQQAARRVLRNIQYTYVGNPDLVAADDFVDP